MTTVTVIIASLTTNMKIAIIIIVAITKNNYNYNNNSNNNNNNYMHTADLLHRIWQICDILADLLRWLADLLRAMADLLRALADLWHLADLLQPTFVFNPHVSASRHYLSGTKERQQGEAGQWIGISYIVVDWMKQLG